MPACYAYDAYHHCLYLPTMVTFDYILCCQTISGREGRRILLLPAYANQMGGRILLLYWEEASIYQNLDTCNISACHCETWHFFL